MVMGFPGNVRPSSFFSTVPFFPCRDFQFFPQEVYALSLHVTIRKNLPPDRSLYFILFPISHPSSLLRFSLGGLGMLWNCFFNLLYLSSPMCDLSIPSEDYPHAFPPPLQRPGLPLSRNGAVCSSMNFDPQSFTHFFVICLFVA